MIVLGARVVAVRQPRAGGPRHATGTAGGTGAAGGNVTDQDARRRDVTINPRRMAEMAKRMEEAGKRMESAQKSGDSAAAGKAMGDILGAVTGSGNAAPIPAADLKAMLPESIGDMKRTRSRRRAARRWASPARRAKAIYAAGDAARRALDHRHRRPRRPGDDGRLGQHDGGQGDRRQGREGLQGRRAAPSTRSTARTAATARWR